MFAWKIGGTKGAAGVAALAIPGPVRGVSELRPGQAWRSDNGRTVLRLCEKGRLSLLLDGRVAWRPKARDRADKLLLNGQGQLVLFSVESDRLWVVGSPGAPDVELHLQEDGNAVLYSRSVPLWNSDTRLS